jgi:hypothetical protein
VLHGDRNILHCPIYAVNEKHLYLAEAFFRARASPPVPCTRGPARCALQTPKRPRRRRVASVPLPAREPGPAPAPADGSRHPVACPPPRCSAAHARDDGRLDRVRVRRPSVVDLSAPSQRRQRLRLHRGRARAPRHLPPCHGVRLPSRISRAHTHKPQISPFGSRENQPAQLLVLWRFAIGVLPDQCK